MGCGVGFRAAAPCSSHQCLGEVWNFRQCYGGAPSGSARGSGSANQNHSTSLARAISYLTEVERLSRLMPPSLLDPSSFASPPSPPFHFTPLSIKWGSLFFRSSTALHLPLSLFIFQSCTFSVIGYALLKCVIGLYARVEKWVWSHYRSVANTNECVRERGCVSEYTAEQEPKTLEYSTL